jgi:Na+/glutamate symporter
MGQLAAEGAANSAAHEAQSQLGSAGTLGRIAGGALGGGLGGFGRKKKQEQPQPQQQQPSDAKNQQALASVLMEAQTEKQGFSSASVDNSVFNVPAGYKQVESEMLRRAR